ncbi:MAG: hypothetical protein SNJ82_07890, partial [Gemmataceae bacterium]
KCPMCEANFIVPTLPTGVANPPPVAALGDSPSGSSLPSSEPETYGLKNEPVPAFNTTAASNPPSDAAPSTPMPAFATERSHTPSPSPSPAPAAASLPPVSPAALGGSLGSATWDTAASSSASSSEPSTSIGCVLDPKILQFVPAVALVLIFVLHFFPWVGVYGGDYEITSQGAWGTALGATTRVDPDLSEFFKFKTDEEVRNQPNWDEKTATGNNPQFSLLTFFYLLPLFFLGLIASVGVVALHYIQTPLPPQIQQILPWRWAIVVGINALLLLFVVLQFLLPFSLESRMTSYAYSDPKLKPDDQDKSEVSKKKQVLRGRIIQQVKRTTWFNLVVLLHLVAAVAAGLVYWIEKRGPGKPLPRLELRF